MTTIHLDGTQLTSPTNVHRMFAQAFQFPAWYGNNLDALYDLLTDVSDTTLHLCHTTAVEAQLGSYGTRLLTTLRDAATENPSLTLILLP